jgi:glycosyltransferase involved in cell wall biosynthesis
MKVIHVPFGYAPDPIGGTEVYVHALAKGLQGMGLGAVVAAPGPAETQYSIEGIHVYRYPVPEVVSDLREIYGGSNAAAAADFGRVLDDERPDIVHLHAFTRGASLLAVREAKRRGKKVVFTYHTPTVSCQRGTLLRWGKDVCDGRLDVHRCADCTLQGLGLDRTPSRMLGALPPAVGKLVGSSNLRGGLWTALRMTQLVELRHVAFRALMREVDHVVVLRQWTRELLLRNDVPAEKITVSPHGLIEAAIPEDTSIPLAKTGPDVLRIAFLGRMDRSKGLEVLIAAVRAIRDVPLVLHAYGITQNGSQEFQRQLQRLVDDDRRIELLNPVRSDQVVALLRNYDVLAVPSQCLETGPLVVLDAFAAGIPVIGSNLGGIAEIVHHGVDGLLVDRDSVAAWSSALRRLAQDAAMLQRLRQGVKPPRGMDAVVDEMARIYDRILGSAIRDQSAGSAGNAHAHR